MEKKSPWSEKNFHYLFCPSAAFSYNTSWFLIRLSSSGSSYIGFETGLHIAIVGSEAEFLVP